VTLEWRNEEESEGIEWIEEGRIRECEEDIRID